MEGLAWCALISASSVYSNEQNTREVLRSNFRDLLLMAVVISA